MNKITNSSGKLWIGTAAIMLLCVSCSIGFLPSWKNKDYARIVITLPSLKSVNGTVNGRAIAGSSGFLYLQTGLKTDATKLYGPYKATAGSETSIKDIPPGTYDAITIIFTPEPPKDKLLSFTATESSISAVSAALQTHFADEGDLLASASFGLLSNVKIEEGKTNPISATLIPMTNLSPNTEGKVTLAGKEDTAIRRFIRFDGLQNKFTGLTPSSATTLTLSVLNGGTGQSVISAVALFDAAGKLGDLDDTDITIASGSIGNTDVLWNGSDTAYFYIEFTGSSLELKFGVTLPVPAVPPVTHVITFNANGGVGTMSPQTVIQGASVTLSLNAYSYAGFSFLGWSAVQASATADYVNGASYTMGTADVILYAIWGPPGTRTVSFNANGGTGTIAPMSGPEGSSITLPAGSAFIFGSNTFLGWSPNFMDTTPVYLSGASFNLGAADTTLYAIWDILPVMRNISFEPNGGTGTMGGMSGLEGSSITMPASAFTYGSNTFLGWSTNVMASVPDYIAGATYTFGASDAAFFAVWSMAIIRNVSFDPNGGTGSMTPMSGPEGTDITLMTNSFSRPGFMFNGWGLSAGATTPDYANSALFTFPASDTPLYALWLDNVAPVISGTVDINGGAPFTNSPFVTITIPINSDGSGILYITCTGAVFTGSTTVSGNTVAFFSSSIIELGTPVTAGGVLTLANVDLSGAEGTKTVSFTVTDVASNTSASVSNSIFLDTIDPPTPSVLSNPDATFWAGTYYSVGSTADFTFQSLDGSGSGVVGYSTTPGGVTSTLLTLSPGSITIYARDNAGNVCTTPFMLTLIQDSISPVCTGSSVSGGTITVNYMDAGSGVSTYIADMSTSNSGGTLSDIATVGAMGYMAIPAITNNGTSLELTGWSAGAAVYYYLRIQMTDHAGNYMAPVYFSLFNSTTIAPFP